MSESTDVAQKSGQTLSFLRRVGVLFIVAMGGASAVWILRPSGLEDAHITSGSMANSFWGPSFRVTCGDCGFSFRCDAEEEFVPTDRRAVCPNCAFGNNPLTRQNRDPFGQAVKIDVGYLRHKALDRWIPVAIHVPGKSNSVGVKRIVGLSNEWIAIRQGDVYADGHLLRKPLAVQRELAVLVHDARFRPDHNPRRNRWRPKSENSGWTQTESGFFFDGTGDSHPEAGDWLEYRNVPTEPLALGLQRPDEAPINDNSGYNQGISRGLNDVQDLMLSCWVRLAGNGSFVLAAFDRDCPIEVSILARTHIMWVRIGGRVVRQRRIPSMVNRPRKLELSLFDRQCMVAVDGRCFARILLGARGRHAAPSRPFRIGAKDLRVWVNQLRVFRDIYYLNDRGLALPWRVRRRLGNDEYFLLGDNPPISFDSRHWSPSGVPRKSLLGKVTRAPNRE